MSFGRPPLFEVVSRIGDPAGERELRSLLPALDTRALVKQSARHGLSAHVADAFARLGLELPSFDHEALARDARQTVAQAAKNRRLLFSVIGALAKRDLVPVLLKGHGLATRLYDAPLNRPSTDVDVLVQPPDLPVVREALEALHLHAQPDPALADVHLEHHHEAFAGPAGLVEVHFRLFAGFGMATFDDVGVELRSRHAQLEGHPVRYLSPEDEFVYLCVHAANHAFLRASWLVDLQQYVRRTPLAWATAAQLARRLEFSVAYASALEVLRTVMRVDLPKEAWLGLPTHRVRSAIHPLLFSAENLASAAVADSAQGSAAVRVWLSDSPRRALNEVRHGLLRLGRREWAKRRRGAPRRPD